MLKKAEIQICMDGKGAWHDTVFVERLSRTIKYDEVYFKANDSFNTALKSLGRYLAFYNIFRPHLSIYSQKTNEAYFRPPTAIPLAA